MARYKSPKSQEMQLLLGDRQAGVGDTHPPTCPQLMLQTPKDHRTPYILAAGADPPKCPQGTEPYEILSWKGPIRITESNSWLHTKNQTTRLRTLSKRSLNSSTQGCAHRPVVQPLSLTPSCPSPDSSMPFPRALSLSHRAELSAAPPLPVRSCSRHEAFPQLLCSALSNHSGLHAPHTPCPADPSLSLQPFFWMLHLIEEKAKGCEVPWLY